MTSIKHSYSNSVKPKTNFYFGPYGIKGMTYEKYRQNNIKDKQKSNNISKPTFLPWTPSRVKYELKMPNIFHHQDYVYTRDSEDNEYSLDINIGENFSQKVFDLDIDFKVITKENDEHIYLIADFFEKPFDFVDDYQIVNISRKIEAILIGIDDAIKEVYMTKLYLNSKRRSMMKMIIVNINMMNMKKNYTKILLMKNIIPMMNNILYLFL